MKAKTLKTLIDPFPIVIMIVFDTLSLIINIIYSCSAIVIKFSDRQIINVVDTADPCFTLHRMYIYYIGR